MSREQIEEIENAIGEYYGCDGRLYNSFAKYLYKQSIRKQSEGEWLEIDDGVSIGDGKHLECSKCGVWKQNRQRSNFCSHCGAKMKGGAE